MPDFDVGRYRYQDRATVLGYVEDALHAADAPLKDPLGTVEVIVRVIAPQEAGQRDPNWNVDAELAKALNK